MQLYICDYLPGGITASSGQQGRFCFDALQIAYAALIAYALQVAYVSLIAYASFYRQEVVCC